MKQHLAAIRALCDSLVDQQVLPVNPAASVRGPKRVRSSSGRPLGRRAVLAMIKRRAASGGLPAFDVLPHVSATGITAYLSNGGTLEHAQRIAGHASPKTTTLDEVERIVI